MHAIGGEVANRVSRPILRRLTRRRSTQHAARSVPAKAPDGVKPIFEKQMPEATIDGIRAAFLRIDECPMVHFLKEVMECYNFANSDWKPDPTVPGTLVRKVQYSAPVPSDVPESIARLVGLPPVIDSTSVFRLRTAESGELTLVQQSYTRDVMYGDRFKIQFTIAFKEEADGIVSRQWTQIIWDQPLPWTHSMIRHFIERRARADSTRIAGVVLRMIEDAVQAVEPQK